LLSPQLIIMSSTFQKEFRIADGEAVASDNSKGLKNGCPKTRL